jgi:predicted nucleic acid-binding protein
MKVAVTKRFVLDASVALAWCFPGEATAETEMVLDSLSNGAEAFVPALWPFELANALLVGERRKRISVAQVTSMLQRIAYLPIAVQAVQPDRIFGQVLALARQHGLSEYDSAYLDLALREALPVATLDQTLRKAAQNAGLRLIAI